MHTHAVSQQLVVLTPTLTERLQCVTSAQRVLSQQGLRVVEQDLQVRPGARPLLKVNAGSEALRQQLTKIIIRREADHRVVTGRFMDVDVSYTEALSS